MVVAATTIAVVKNKWQCVTHSISNSDDNSGKVVNVIQHNVLQMWRRSGNVGENRLCNII